MPQYTYAHYIFDICTQTPLKVLEGLLEEDDEVVDTWYLLGLLSTLRVNSDDGDEGYKGNARFYLSRAKKVHAAKPTDDAQMVSE